MQIYVKELMELENKRNDFQAEFNKLQEEFNKKHEKLINDIISTKAEIESIKGTVQGLALTEFDNTKNKKLYGGIGIRESITLNYSEEEALKWAEINMPVVRKLALDKKVFEKFAKDNVLDFVNKEPKITVTFPKEWQIPQESIEE